MRAVLFPGQGVQHRGMGAALFGRFRNHVAAADRILGFGIEALCRDDPQDELSRTAFTQPAVYVVSVLAYLDVLRTAEAEPDCLAGHSVGEYAALAAAGAFDFETGLRLVQQRAVLMARADGGGLVAVIGPSVEVVTELLCAPGLRDLAVANVNTPTQTVVGGPAAQIEHVLTLCAERGYRAVRLRVSGAFHTPAMGRAADEFRAFLATVPIERPRIPVALNRTGRLHFGKDSAGTALDGKALDGTASAGKDLAGDDLREVLAQQMASPVLWSGCIRALLDAGATRFTELPAPGVLTAMVAEIRAAPGIAHPPPADPSRIQRGDRP